MIVKLIFDFSVSKFGYHHYELLIFQGLDGLKGEPGEPGVSGDAVRKWRMSFYLLNLVLQTISLVKWIWWHLIKIFRFDIFLTLDQLICEQKAWSNQDTFWPNPCFSSWSCLWCPVWLLQAAGVKGDPGEPGSPGPRGQKVSVQTLAIDTKIFYKVSKFPNWGRCNDVITYKCKNPRKLKQ